MTVAAPGWTILVPVKATSRGKSRLAVSAEQRRRLALAMAMDTVAAAARCGSVGAVLAVVENESDGEALGGIAGVRVHRTAVTGLNESILDGVKALSAVGGRSSSPVAVLPGDLPGVRPAELAEALARCAQFRFAVVADHQGVGTTLLAATDAGALQPHYGPDSFRRHQEAGAIPVALPPASSLRLDVDTVGDLEALAGALGDTSVAARTRAVVQHVTAGPRGR